MASDHQRHSEIDKAVNHALTHVDELHPEWDGRFWPHWEGLYDDSSSERLTWNEVEHLRVMPALDGPIRGDVERALFDVYRNRRWRHRAEVAAAPIGTIEPAPTARMFAGCTEWILHPASGLSAGFRVEGQAGTIMSEHFYGDPRVKPIGGAGTAWAPRFYRLGIGTKLYKAICEARPGVRWKDETSYADGRSFRRSLHHDDPYTWHSRQCPECGDGNGRWTSLVPGQHSGQ